jgi:polar amino acid transport system substrate-binding protein
MMKVAGDGDGANNENERAYDEGVLHIHATHVLHERGGEVFPAYRPRVTGAFHRNPDSCHGPCNALLMNDIESVRAEIAPHGTLRAAINFGNTVLTVRGATLEESGGVSVQIARELARRLDLPLQLLPYEGAGDVVAVAKNDVFDIAFMAIDPQRAGDVNFTAPYVLIEGGYMVKDDSPLKSVDEVDRPGIKMTVGLRSAYDLYLTRTIKHAEIVREPTSIDAIELFMRGGFDVSAGVKASLADYVASHDGVRLLDGRFMVIEQAMVTVHGAKALEYISALIEDVKASGFVKAELDKSGQSDAVVAPPKA